MCRDELETQAFDKKRCTAHRVNSTETSYLVFVLRSLENHLHTKASNTRTKLQNEQTSVTTLRE